MPAMRSRALRRAPLLPTLALVALASPAAAASDGLLFKKSGRFPAADYGHALAAVGDVNGDGFDDFLVGSPGDGAAGEASGTAYLLSGRRGRTLYSFAGATPGERLGYAVAGTGDVDGDGWPDFAVTAPAIGAGRVDVYSGQDGSLLHRIFGGATSGLFGGFVDGAGDVDGDGHADFVVSSPRAGRVEVFSGLDASRLYRFEGFAGVSNIVRLEARGVGDVDGDGSPDLLVGEPVGGAYRGRAHLFSGRTGERIRLWQGTRHRSAWFGYAVAGLDDVDGDGLPDLLIGYANRLRRNFITGEAQVRSGRDGGLVKRFRGPLQSASFGRSVGAAGDVDGDGVGDYLVGAPYFNGNKGRATLISGRSGRVLRHFVGSRRGLLGYTLTGAGDVDGDGFADLVIASPAEDSHRGAIRVYSGRALTAPR